MSDIANNLEFKYLNNNKELLDDVKKLFLEYAKSLPIDLDFQNFEDELTELPGKYAPPTGTIILAFVNNRPVGIVALRKIENDICEMKRLYVKKNYQGLGIGKKLAEKIITEAKDKGYNYMRLDTLSSLKKALNLYKSLGFYKIDAYIYNPMDNAIYMERELN